MDTDEALIKPNPVAVNFVREVGHALGESFRSKGIPCDVIAGSFGFQILIGAPLNFSVCVGARGDVNNPGICTGSSEAEADRTNTAKHFRSLDMRMTRVEREMRAGVGNPKMGDTTISAGSSVATPDSEQEVKMNDNELIRLREQHPKALVALASVVLELSGPDNPLTVKTQGEIRYALMPYLRSLDIKF